MNTYNSLYHNTLLREMEKRREYYMKITNQMFGKVIVDQCRFINQFKDNLVKALNNNPDFGYEVSSNYVTVHSKKEFADPKYGFSKDIANISLKDNKINFRRKGSNSVTKSIKFGRELTPEKAARYIIRFGTK